MGENVFKYTTIKHLDAYLLLGKKPNTTNKPQKTNKQNLSLKLHLPPEQSGFCALDGDFRVQGNVKNLY